MLSLALKNSIIAYLVILIIHFFLRNNVVADSRAVASERFANGLTAVRPTAEEFPLDSPAIFDTVVAVEQPVRSEESKHDDDLDTWFKELNLSSPPKSLVKKDAEVKPGSIDAFDSNFEAYSTF